MTVVIIILLISLCFIDCHERAPPGINPQMYSQSSHVSNQPISNRHSFQGGASRQYSNNQNVRGHQQQGSFSSQMSGQNNFGNQKGFTIAPSSPLPDKKQGFGNEGQVNNPSPQTQGVNSQGYKTMSMGFNAGQDTNNINSDQGLNRTDTAGNEKPIASENQFRVQGSGERIVKQPQIQHGRDANFDQHRVLHKNITHEKEHMRAHMDVPVDTSKLSEKELQFHYFKMHDSDNNNKLDGCELVKSLIHWHANDGKEHRHHNVKIFGDNELATMIDPILRSDDKNKDGFIDYYEFIAAQKTQVKLETQ